MSTASTTPRYRHDPHRDLGVTEASVALGIHPMTTRRYLADGLLYGWKRGGTRWMVPRGAVADFIAGNDDHALDPDAEPAQTPEPLTSDPLVAAISAMVALAPPLSPTQRDKLAGLLRVPDNR